MIVPLLVYYAARIRTPVPIDWNEGWNVSHTSRLLAGEPLYLSFTSLPNCELKTLPDAGHACQIEQPWLFDRFMIEFLAKLGLFPGAAAPARTII